MDRRFTEVPKFSDRRRIPLLGKIRLGIKQQKDKTSRCKHGAGESCFYCSYPKEVEYFVVPPEVAKIYGDKPTKLDVFLPSDDRGITMPCSLRRYGSTKGLKCIGNKSVGLVISTREEIICPCEHYEKDCKEVGFLFVILPNVNLGGVYQIRTGSYNSVQDILSGMDYVEALLKRPCSFVPLELRRIRMETHHDEKKQIHYTMQLVLPDGFNIDKANKLIEDSKRIYDHQFQLPAPKDENPALGTLDVLEGQEITDEEDDKKEDPPEPKWKVLERLMGEYTTKTKGNIYKLKESLQKKNKVSMMSELPELAIDSYIEYYTKELKNTDISQKTVEELEF